MNTNNTPAFTRSLASLPPGHTVAEALNAMCRAEGLEPSNREQLANLPPWPEEDAAAFEKVIDDMFERIDEDTHPL